MEAIEILVDELVKRGIDAKIIQDSGWDNGQSGGRCITDFKRYVRFNRKLTSEELTIVKKIMEEQKCPGWTGVNGYLFQEDQLEYRFSTTWDSSD